MEKKLNQLFQLLFFLFALIFFTASILSLINIIKYSPVGTDAGYYLSYAREISKGKILLRDLSTRHPFAVMYFYSLLPLLGISSSQYHFYLIFQSIIFLLISFLIFLITKELKLKISLQLLASSLVLFFLLRSEAFSIFLEPFLILFTLLTIYLLLKNPKFYFLAGITSFLALFSKQYGLATLPVSLLFIFLNNNSKINNKSFLQILNYFSGLISSIVLALIYFSLINKIILLDLYQLYFNNSDYISRVEFNQKLESFFSYINLNRLGTLFIFIIFIFIPVQKKFTTKQKSLFASLILLLLLNFLAVFIGYPFLHYFQLIVSPIILLSFLKINNLKLNPKLNLLFHSIFILFLLFVLRKGIYDGTLWLKIKGDKTQRQDQYELSRKLNSIVPVNSKVYIFNRIEYFFLANYNSPSKEMGFEFPTINFQENIWQKEFSNVNYAFIFDGNDVNPQIARNILEKNNFKLENKLETKFNWVEIWKKSS